MSTTPASRTSAPFRDRIGGDLAGGLRPAPHRYHLYLALGCPHSQRVLITLALLGLDDAIGCTFLPPATDSPEDLACLRAAYEKARQPYDGPLTVPALCDRWSSRVVSNHTPDILDDLALHFADPDDDRLPRLRPAELADRIDALRELLDAGAADEAVLDLLDAHLAASPYVLGDHLTAADVDVWAALEHLEPDALRSAAARVHLWSYVRRLVEQPAFRGDHPPADDTTDGTADGTPEHDGSPQQQDPRPHNSPRALSAALLTAHRATSRATRTPART